MEFKMIQKEIQLQSRGWIPTFHDITIDIHKMVEESGIQNGTNDPIGDRKYNNGEVVNTLRKFPAEEKAYMAQYDEWKIR